MWRPIATAPLDGSWVIIRGESGYIDRPCRVAVARWDEEYRPASPWITSEGDCWTDEGDNNDPVLWMEIPEGVQEW